MTARAASLLLLVAAALAAPASPARAEASSADGVVSVTTETRADSVTVGQRFEVTYHATFPDSLHAVAPRTLPAGTCRVVSAAWSDATPGESVGRVVFMPVSLDSVVVLAFPLDFVSSAGDTLRAWTDRVDLTLTHLAAESEDLRPLKEQWEAPRNWLAWIAAGLGILALAVLVAWWFRRRRARTGETAEAEIRLPPDFVALKELERIEALGLVERGEFKAFYTLVVDAVRRYTEARFGVEAMDRTSAELLGDLDARGRRVDGLDALLNEADLVKFAKLAPTSAAATAAIESARALVVATTPKLVPAEEPRGATG